MSSVLDAGLCVRSNQLDFDFDYEVAFAAERSLFGHLRSGWISARSADVVSFSHPHDPFAIPAKWWDLYRDEDIPNAVPRLRRGRAASAPAPAPRRLRDERHRGHRAAGPDGPPGLRHRAISYVDDHISRLIGVLRGTGRLDRTVIIVTSDHGEMLGERGAWSKMSFY